MDINLVRSSIHEANLVVTSFVGTGAADPTKLYGQGVTITHQATGVYRYTFKEGNGTFIGCMPTLGADTMSAVKAFSFVRGKYDATNKLIDISIFNGSAAAADLAALQYLDVWFFFAGTGSP